MRPPSPSVRVAIGGPFSGVSYNDYDVTIGKWFSEGFRLYRRHFILYTVIYLFWAALFMTLTYLTASILRTQDSNKANLVALFLSSLVSLALHTFWHAGFYMFSFKTFFSLHHTSLDPSQTSSWVYALMDFFPFRLLCISSRSSSNSGNNSASTASDQKPLGMWMLMAEQALEQLLILIGFLLLVLPGIYLLFALSFALPLVLHHSTKGLMACMGHSIKQQNKHLFGMIAFHVLAFGLILLTVLIPSGIWGISIWNEFFPVHQVDDSVSKNGDGMPVLEPLQLAAQSLSKIAFALFNSDTVTSDASTASRASDQDPSSLWEELDASIAGRYSVGFILCYYLLSAVLRPIYYAVMTACYSDVFGIEFSELLNPSAAALRDINASFEDDDDVDSPVPRRGMSPP
eukprot:ANDGO_07386.mRNA.1 hypothetical protein